MFNMVYMLKSDQNGIEIRRGGDPGLWFLGLKSDQNGIEIFMDRIVEIFRILVKIRPKWDWNLK